MPNESKELTYGEKAVGITFNPSGSGDVQLIKELCAKVIDIVNTSQPNNEMSRERASVIEESVRQMQTAQMWAVKAVTYQY